MHVAGCAHPLERELSAFSDSELPASKDYDRFTCTRPGLCLALSDRPGPHGIVGEASWRSDLSARYETEGSGTGAGERMAPSQQGSQRTKVCALCGVFWGLCTALKSQTPSTLRGPNTQQDCGDTTVASTLSRHPSDKSFIFGRDFHWVVLNYELNNFRFQRPFHHQDFSPKKAIQTQPTS